MSRFELARLLLILTMLPLGLVIAYLVVLHRERRRRMHWSTRNRIAHPHWSITLATRIERFGARLSSRLRWRRNRHHNRQRKRDL